jgi:enamine deaminase RidA (YjgF/YER057c/UK114 family)
MNDTSKRQTFSCDSKWEPLVGYSRAVRVGPLVHVSGTTAADGQGEIADATDAAAEEKLSIRKIEQVLEAAGASLRDVVRPRIYVADINDWQAVGEVHRQAFEYIQPAATMVEVNRFISPDILVEIEVDAIVDTDRECKSDTDRPD